MGGLCSQDRRAPNLPFELEHLCGLQSRNQHGDEEKSREEVSFLLPPSPAAAPQAQSRALPAAHLCPRQTFSPSGQNLPIQCQVLQLHGESPRQDKSSPHFLLIALCGVQLSAQATQDPYFPRHFPGTFPALPRPGSDGPGGSPGAQPQQLLTRRGWSQAGLSPPCHPRGNKALGHGGGQGQQTPKQCDSILVLFG